MRSGMIGLVLGLGLAFVVGVGGARSAWGQDAVAVPTDVRATGSSKNRKVIVTWRDVAAEEGAQYRVERSLVARLDEDDGDVFGKAAEGEPFFEVLSVLTATVDPAGGHAQRFVDKSTEPNAEYAYRVVKVEGDAESAPSAEDQASTPGPRIKRRVNVFAGSRRGWSATISVGSPAVERAVSVEFDPIVDSNPGDAATLFNVTVKVDGLDALGGVVKVRKLSKRVVRVRLVATPFASLLGRQFDDHAGLPVKARFALPPPIHFIGQPLFDEFRVMHVRLKAAFNPANPLIGSFRRRDFDVNRAAGFTQISFLALGAGKKKAVVGEVVAMVADVHLVGPGPLLHRNDGSARLAFDVTVVNGRIVDAVAVRDPDSVLIRNVGKTSATLSVDHLTPFLRRQDARARFVFLVEVLPAAAGGELRMEIDRIPVPEGRPDPDESSWLVFPFPPHRILEVAVER